MPRVCLSYRRSDSLAIVGRIYDRLCARYGADAVFMDLTGIPYGTDFRQRILDAWQDSHVLVAVIGPGWRGQTADGGARIDEDLDPVRVEILIAMRQSLLIIPVLVDDAKMPGADELPRNIRDLSYLNGMPVNSGLDFEPHMQRLTTAIDEALGVEPTITAQGLLSGAGAGVVKPKQKSFFEAAKSLLLRVLPFFAIPVILLLLAHYLIVIKMDSDSVYIRPFAVLLPLASGYLLLRIRRLGIVVAMLLGLSIALVSVFGMLAVVALVDQHAILPSSIAGWQEVFEFLATITLSTLAGSLLAYLVVSTVPGRWRLF